LSIDTQVIFRWILVDLLSVNHFEVALSCNVYVYSIGEVWATAKHFVVDYPTASGGASGFGESATQLSTGV
jgi:hypothetical protein